MGIWDTITDLVEAATPWGTAEAEAPSSNPAGAGPAKESAVRHLPTYLLDQPTYNSRDIDEELWDYTEPLDVQLY